MCPPRHPRRWHNIGLCPSGPSGARRWSPKHTPHCPPGCLRCTLPWGRRFLDARRPGAAKCASRLLLGLHHRPCAQPGSPSAGRRQRPPCVPASQTLRGQRCGKARGQRCHAELFSFPWILSLRQKNCATCCHFCSRRIDLHIQQRSAQGKQTAMRSFTRDWESVKTPA